MLIHNLLSFAGKVLAKNKLSILIYHQVFEKTDPMRASEPDVKSFRWQMELVAKYFHPLSITDALEHIDQCTLPANAICITFDDGYINNLTVAAPILSELNMPATVYVATAFSDGENMWNDRIIDLVSSSTLSRLLLKSIKEETIELVDNQARVKAAHHLIKKVKYRAIAERKEIITALYLENGIEEFPRKMMSPNQIKQLHDLGIEIGGHTVDHPILKVLNESEQRLQIKQSKDELDAILGYAIKGFAYPNGKVGIDYDSVTRNIVQELGFDYAVSTNWGVSNKEQDKYQLNRFSPWDKTPLKYHYRLMRNLIGK